MGRYPPRVEMNGVYGVAVSDENIAEGEVHADIPDARRPILRTRRHRRVVHPKRNK